MKDRVWQDRFETWAGPIAAQSGTPGIAAAAAVAGRPVYFHGFGLRDREQSLALTPDTVFGVGSITKSMTAVAVLQLQEAGRLSVDDALARHLPELRLPNSQGATPIRLHHLLTHSSGLPPLRTLTLAMLSSMRLDPDVPAGSELDEAHPVETPADMIDYLNGLDIQALGAPGEVFSYSNDGYSLLGHVIERVSGESYPAYMRRHVFEPAGMVRTWVDKDGRLSDPDMTVLYARRLAGAVGPGEVVRAPLHWKRPAMLAGGSVWSTASDLLRYLEIYRTGGTVEGVRILGADSVRAMQRPYIECAIRQGYGYGLMITPAGPDGGAVRIEHGGASKGVAAEVLLAPEAGLTVAVLANLAGAPSARIAGGLLNAYLGGDDLSAPRVLLPDWPADAAAAAALGGVYGSDEGGSIEIRPAADGAIAVVTEGQHLLGRPVGDRSFVLDVDGEERHVTWRTLGDGEIAVAFGLRVLRRMHAPA